MPPASFKAGIRWDEGLSLAEVVVAVNLALPMGDTDTRPPTLLDEIREELPRVWAAIPDKGLVLGLLAAWLALG